MNQSGKSSAQCATCKKPTRKADHPHFPFCSERCKTIDLGAWLSDKYAIEGNEPLPPEESPEN